MGRRTEEGKKKSHGGRLGVCEGGPEQGAGEGLWSRVPLKARFRLFPSYLPLTPKNGFCLSSVVDLCISCFFP